MPYIPKDKRDQLVEHPEGLAFAGPGEINYLITAIINEYIEMDGLSYSSINECIGILECAKLELYRRIAAPYEDLKKEQNGDVYTCQLNK